MVRAACLIQLCTPLCRRFITNVHNVYAYLCVYHHSRPKVRYTVPAALLAALQRDEDPPAKRDSAGTVAATAGSNRKRRRKNEKSAIVPGAKASRGHVEGQSDALLSAVEELPSAARGALAMAAEGQPGAASPIEDASKVAVAQHGTPHSSDDASVEWSTPLPSWATQTQTKRS